jgi:hypothetical protein
MKDQGTAVQKLMSHEPALVIRPMSVVLRVQNDNTASSQPEGVLVDSPLHRSGVIVREETASTSIDAPVSVIF